MERARRTGNLKPRAMDYYHTGKKLVFGFLTAEKTVGYPRTFERCSFVFPWRDAPGFFHITSA